jgi:hypothetical protein
VKEKAYTSLIRPKLEYSSCVWDPHTKSNISKHTSSNTTYKATSFDKDEILANHRSFMTSLSIPAGKESEGLPYLYWIPKLHKTPYKENTIVLEALSAGTITYLS